MARALPAIRARASSAPWSPPTASPWSPATPPSLPAIPYPSSSSATSTNPAHDHQVRKQVVRSEKLAIVRGGGWGAAARDPYLARKVTGQAGLRQRVRGRRDSP